MEAPSPPLWPLCSATARLQWLRSCCAVAEGADVVALGDVHDAALVGEGADDPDPTTVAVRPSIAQPCAPDVCVAAVLGDALRRVAVLGGREGMSRSLGSVYGGSVTRFLGGSVRDVIRRVVDTPGLFCWSNSIAVSGDGSSLLMSDADGCSHAIHVFDVASGAAVRVVGSKGDGRLQFRCPYQVWVAPDGFVFVADWGNNRVQVLTPALEFHAFVGVGQLSHPRGVCANDDVIVVSEVGAGQITVFRRRDAAIVHRFGTSGDGDGQLRNGSALCFLSDNRHVAVSEITNNRVSVFAVDGAFVRHVGVGVLRSPVGIACSAFDELVVGDAGNCCVRLFSNAGELLMSVGNDGFSGVVIHGGVMVARVSDCCGTRATHSAMHPYTHAHTHTCTHTHTP